MMALTKDLAPRPALSRLSMMLRPTALDVVISPAFLESKERLAYHSIPFPQAMPTLQAFEECVYANPLLLADFASVDLLIDTPRYLLAPTAVISDDMCIDMLQGVWPSAADFAVSALADSDMSLMMAPADGILPFIRRTWLDAAICHPLHPLASYFARQGYEGSAICVSLEQGATYCVVFDGGRLVGVNSSASEAVPDRAYHLLATAKAYSQDHLSTWFMLSGDLALRNDVSAILRQMNCRVMAAPFPAAALAAGSDATIAPFPLIVTIY